MGFPFQCDAPSVELGAGKDTSQAWSAVATGSAVRRVSEQECIAMACIPPGRQPCTLPGTGRQTHAQVVGRASIGSVERSASVPSFWRAKLYRAFSDRQTGPSALFVVPMRRGRAASSPEASTLAMNKPVGGVGGARSALKTPKKSNGPPPLDRAAGAGPTNTRRSGAVSASGVQANGAALGARVAEPRSARSRNMPPGCNSRTHRLSRSLPPGATAAWVTSASQCPPGSISGEPGITSAGNSTSSVESGSLPASFRATASTRKMRERTGGPAWRVVTTNRNPSGVHATPVIRSGTLE